MSNSIAARLSAYVVIQQIHRPFATLKITSLSAVGTMVHWYTMTETFDVERVQTGVRIEKRLLKVLKGFAEYHDLSLGDLLEGIVLHAFDGKCPFNQASLYRIKDLKKFYGLELDSSASHRLRETKLASRKRRKS